MNFYYSILFVFFIFVLSLSSSPSSHRSHRSHRIISSLLQVDSTLKTRLPFCKLILSKLCDPCFKAPLNPFLCLKWQKKCQDTLCVPLCTRLTWEVNIKARSCSGEHCNEFKEQMNSERYQNALRAHLIAHGCAHLSGCCSESDELMQWLEHRLYGGYFPQPLLPIPACQKISNTTSQSDLCSMCKSSLAISVKGRNLCSDFPKKEGVPSSLKVNYKHSKVPEKPQKPKHKSYQEKCTKLAIFLSSEFTLFQETFNRGACQCLGCCPSGNGPRCYFDNIVYSDIPSALRDAK